MRGIVFTLLALFSLCALPNKGLAQKRTVTYSLQGLALTPNAGGQDAYAFRRGTDSSEFSLFLNTYLQAGGYPLMGGFYSLRFPLCGHSCMLQLFAQAGIGLSTAGPAVELLWGSVFFWTMRVDIATHIFFLNNRAVTWSYPLWVGLALPI